MRRQSPGTLAHKVERVAAKLFATDDDAGRQAYRATRTAVVRAAFFDWLTEQRERSFPKSPLGEAVAYTLTNWEALGRYVEQGYLAIDNNLSEWKLRQVALGRNNWRYCGSAEGGRTEAVLYSVVGTCKHLGIDPFAYLREALPALFALGETPDEASLASWLPDVWQRRGQDAAFPEGVPA